MLEPLTYSVRETAQLLGMSLNQTYISIAAGDIPSRKVGTALRSRVLVPRQALHDWLGETKAKAA